MADVHDNPDRHRFEITIDGDLAGFAEYQARPLGVPTHLVITHTEIDEAFHGKGLGGQLARGVLDAARRDGLRVVPLCPFIAAWIEQHPDYAELVDEDRLRAMRPG